MKYFFISMLLFVIITEHLIKGQELLFKNFARSSRGNRGPDEFEKFFLKASKSVPRIGRREFDSESSKNHENSPSKVHPTFARIDKKYDPNFKDLSWYDLADTVEYYPEILMSPGFLTSAGLKHMDSGIDNKRMDSEKNKEIIEYRLQPES